MSLESNPYEFNSQAPIQVEPLSKYLTRRILLPVGLVAFMGTSLAGGIFGLIGGIIGVIFGFCLALITGVPVTITTFAIFAIVGNPQLRKWKLIVLSGVSGGLTGMLACLWPLMFNPAGIMFGIFAAVLGAMGAAFCATVYLSLFAPRDPVSIPMTEQPSYFQ